MDEPMALNLEELEKKVRERFTVDVLDWTTFRGQHCLHIRKTRVVEVLQFLRDDPAADFKMLTDVTCVDRLRLPEDMPGPTEERFVVVYQLTALKDGAMLRVKAYVEESPCEIDSVVELWPAADWAEREVFDMFGVIFNGHPGLKRLLTPETFEGHPLRKDYPLKGRGERDNFPKFTEIPVQCADRTSHNQVWS